MSVVNTGYVEGSSNAVGPSITGYCRVCGKVADDLLSIYQNEIVKELPTMLTTYLPIKISTTDVFPVEICLDCTNGVQNWHLLYQSCLYADIKFREMLETEVKQLADKSHNSNTIDIIDNQVLIKEEPSETRVNDPVQVPLELKEEADLMDFSTHEIDIKPTEECQLISYTVQEIEENNSDNESLVERYSVEPIEIDDSDDEDDFGEPSCSIVKEEVDLGIAGYDDCTTSKVPPSREHLNIGKEDEEIDSSKSERFTSKMAPKNKNKLHREEILQRKRELERLRYQRLKNDPAKREEMKEKERLKYKKKKEKGSRKLVKDMNPREHRAAKKKWKEKRMSHT